MEHFYTVQIDSLISRYFTTKLAALRWARWCRAQHPAVAVRVTDQHGEEVR